MNSCALTLPNRSISFRIDRTIGYIDAAISVVLALLIGCSFTLVCADNFTDLMYTSSFRGAFSWVSKMDWVGALLQAAISVFSLIGLCLIILRIMTTILYLSARGIWDEVHDKKQTPSEGSNGQFDLFGLGGMAKTWVSGKAGTGLDAIIGAFLLLLPDVYRYCDANEKSNVKIEADTTIPQYILKIALETVLSVFIIAMAWNGTLVRGMAVTVDAASTLAEYVVSVNYAGYIDDLVNAGTGYKFIFDADGTSEGEVKQTVAKSLYGKVLSKVRDADDYTYEKIGANIAYLIDTNFRGEVAACNRISFTDKLYASEDSEYDPAIDSYYGNIGYDIITNTTGTTDNSRDGVISVSLSEILMGREGSDVMVPTGVTLVGEDNTWYHIYFKQTSTASGSYFNFN